MAAHGEYGQRDWAKDLPKDAMEFEEWTVLMSSFAKELERATSSLNEYRDETIEEAKSQVKKELNTLLTWQGGMANGTSWKQDLTDDADWMTTRAHSDHTLFGKEQRGMPKKLKEARAKVLKTLELALAKCSKVSDDTQHVDHFADITKVVDEAMRISDITIIEAKMLQNIARDSRTPASNRQAEVQSEIDRIQDSSVLKFSYMHPAIYKKALNFLRGST